jgi:bifunctional enzyme CysN/CysC
MAVALTLEDDIDLSRGDMLARKGNQPWVTQDIDAMVCWMTEKSNLTEGAEYLIKHTTRTTRGRLTGLEYSLDINTLHSDRAAGSLSLNEIGRIQLRTQTPLHVDEYRRNATTGSFILIDPTTFDTVAAGMVLPPSAVKSAVKSAVQSGARADEPATADARTASPNVTRHPSLVGACDRCSEGATIWFTGLSGSGKSTVAMAAEQLLLSRGRPAFVLDGDNLRHGLNADLGFSLADRTENLRRIAHVAALIAGSGQVVLVPAISPLAEHRELAERVHRDAGLDFYEVHVDTPLEICEERDCKGLYAKARAGEIEYFTGITSPYEAPADPDLRIVPDRDPTGQAAQILALVGEQL